MHLWKNKHTKKPLKLSKLDMFSRSKIFISGWKKQTLQLILIQTGRAMKKNSRKQGEAWNWDILHEAIYVHLHKRKLEKFLVCTPRTGLLFYWNFTFIVARYYRGVKVYFFDIETELKQQISQNIEEKLLYCTHCHTNV